ncbi:MAG: TolC family protein, partial [Myxococcota bacterium]
MKCSRSLARTCLALCPLLLASVAHAQPAPSPEPDAEKAPAAGQKVPPPALPAPPIKPAKGSALEAPSLPQGTPTLTGLQISPENVALLMQSEGDELTRDLVAEALAKQPGGLSLETVVQRSVDTSRNVAVAQARLRAAAARLDQAMVGYFPTLTLGASYTRQTPIDNNPEGGDGGA